MPILDPPWIPDLCFASTVSFPRLETIITSYNSLQQIKIKSWWDRSPIGVVKFCEWTGRTSHIAIRSTRTEIKIRDAPLFQFCCEATSSWPDSVLSCTQGFLVTLLPGGVTTGSHVRYDPLRYSLFWRIDSFQSLKEWMQEFPWTHPAWGFFD